jgi:FkbM family methyltransferase
MTRLSYLDRAVNKLRGTYRELTAAQIVSNKGVKLIVDRDLLNDPKIIRALLFNRHERTEAELVRYIAAPGDRVLELGSGLGFISILCAQICGPQHVVTVEGNPAMYGLLKRNLVLNNCPLDARLAVVSLDGGPVQFQIADSMVSSSLYQRDDTTQVSTDSISFRALVAEVKPTIIIMDIEGSEIDLLGTTELPSVRAIGVETHPHIVGQKAIAAMIERLRNMGFHIDDRFPAESNRHLYVRH